MDRVLIQSEFPQDNDIVYLNPAAVAPWPRRTAEAVTQFALENVRYGATHYPRWVQQEAQLREQLRALINAASINEIALLKNTSEALSVVASGLQWNAGDNVVSSHEEFPSNRIPWQAQARHGVEFRAVALSGADPEQQLMQACDANTRVLTISSVQYGSGIRLNLEQLGAFCRKRDILFCVDAIQSIGAQRLDVQAIQADFVMADAHKWMLGPEGIALFYCRAELLEQLQLYQYGWHMVENAGDYSAQSWQPAGTAKRFECGSPNMLGVYALSASLSLLEQIGMDAIENAVLANTGYLIEALQKLNRITLLTPFPAARRAGIVTFIPEHRDVARIHRQLLDNKVICACRQGGIRFSPHFYTSLENLDRAIEIFNLTS